METVYIGPSQCPHCGRLFMTHDDLLIHIEWSHR